MNRENRLLLRHAADLLLANARGMREPCQGGNGELWTCDTCPDRDKRGICATQHCHDANVKTAMKLKALANKGEPRKA